MDYKTVVLLCLVVIMSGLCYFFVFLPSLKKIKQKKDLEDFGKLRLSPLIYCFKLFPVGLWFSENQIHEMWNNCNRNGICREEEWRRFKWVTLERLKTLHGRGFLKSRKKLVDGEEWVEYALTNSDKL